MLQLETVLILSHSQFLWFSIIHAVGHEEGQETRQGTGLALSKGALGLVLIKFSTGGKRALSGQFSTSSDVSCKSLRWGAGLLTAFTHMAEYSLPESSLGKLQRLKYIVSPCFRG